MKELALAADIAGTVWKVEVSEGDLVETDGILMVFESMKMEIPLAAPGPGKVARLLVGPGESVKEGQHVIVLLVE
jgi:biotin carboxyl carrier protein